MAVQDLIQSVKEQQKEILKKKQRFAQEKRAAEESSLVSTGRASNWPLLVGGVVGVGVLLVGATLFLRK